jgi:diguanylate cyclase (GGDEF)-like protein
MIDILANGLVIAGIGVLAGALIPVRKLIWTLPRGKIATKWNLLAVLIVLFMLAYITYGIIFWEQHVVWSDVIVPAVFLFGAVFVWVVASLSLHTATDLRRVALLERENITDPLTGVYNRRYLAQRLEEEVARAKRYAHPLSLLLVDVDYFKRINDNYGHQAGDEVLRHLGELIMNAVREVDIVTRYGGEELLIIAPDATLDTARALAERLRLQVESHELVLSSEAVGKQAIRFTISIGVASFGPDAADAKQLVRRADEALYQAKGGGRNRVAVHKPGRF